MEGVILPRSSFLIIAAPIALILIFCTWYLTSCPGKEIEKVDQRIIRKSEGWNEALEIARNATKKRNLPQQAQHEDIRAWDKIMSGCMKLSQRGQMGAILDSGIPFENEAVRKEMEDDLGERLWDKDGYIEKITKNLEFLKTKPYFAEQVARFQAAFDKASGVKKE